MPGKQVKNWAQYEALRSKGYSKESAARITNADSKKKSHGRTTRKGPKKRHGR